MITIVALTVLPVKANEAQSDTRQLMQIAEYINVDYTEAVKDGEIISEAEYQEMLEFSSLAVEKSHTLEGGAAAVAAAVKLENAIQEKQDPAVIKPITVELRNLLMAIAPEVTLSENLLPGVQTQVLFQQNCIACHGAQGKGDGELAASLEPAPTDFTDKTRAENRSLLGLYDAITNGLEGTAMTAFSQLSDQQRWSLAFYVGSLAFDGQKDALANVPAVMTLHQFVSNSPNTLAQQFPAVDSQLLEQLRVNPTPLFTTTNPLEMAKQQLRAAHHSYLNGDFKQAQALAVSAYLDGFEMVENALDAYDSQLRKDIEKSMMQFRQLTGQVQQQDTLAQTLDTAITQLDRAQNMLSADTLSDSTLFTASFIILLREGLEALLVVMALLTVLVKTQRRDAVKYVHSGWIAAIAAGFGTWWMAQHLISISGASREIMEGVAALLAAAVLFYVGFWMHSKTNAIHWQAYIRDNIHRHLSTGTLWGIAGLAFIAVYREVFETVLFYQSLLTQAQPSQFMSISTGFFAGVVVLAFVAWVMIKFSMRLSIGKFFSFTTYLMLALSFVLMGKAVAALQEAALIAISPLPFNINISWLGIHATWEGILSQLLILLLSLLLLLGFKPFSQRHSTQQS
ncbi:cytochrome c/FTR1 family iron permease [Methylophaga sp. OBS4]|uniref:cytochrome c/FTR1 family iron permease n=1 Tax=Methylophaga sp. OBS4 TaxID=2991935 RepID=UPI00224FE174|nr:cytochrome c/FTR1 family iron permease [Methylophaga sp. OBS4]MCX4187063.1 cytochrome c/FTR1 family iron permease [Methylophaga sp. OBS4]